MARKIWKKHQEAMEVALRLAMIDMPEAPASEIYTNLQLQGFISSEGRPSQRTVERWIKNARGTSRPRWDPWSEGSEWRAEDIRRTWVVLRHVWIATNGRVRWFSEVEARKVAEVQTIVPSLPPLSVWNIARLYLIRKRSEEDTRSIDEFLMFSIESNHDDNQDWMNWYDEAVSKGSIRELPKVDLDFIRVIPDYTNKD